MSSGSSDSDVSPKREGCGSILLWPALSSVVGTWMGSGGGCRLPQDARLFAIVAKRLLSHFSLSPSWLREKLMPAANDTRPQTPSRIRVFRFLARCGCFEVC